ncbi:MAG TPA: (d)CMP kinase [Burkholderiales bacterium]|nr:(d)CMP kinase [Burkholderiales bacterium]
MQERDARDANRPVAPLVPAPDSQVLDSTALSVEQVAARVVSWFRDRTAGRPGGLS